MLLMKYSPPKPLSLNKMVWEKTILFNSAKTEFEIQVDLEHSENRGISTILFKFVKSFVARIPQLRGFPSKTEEE